MKTELKGIDKANSSFAKQIKRLKNEHQNLFDAHLLYKKHIEQMNNFIKHLLDEKRITKEELKKFIAKRPRK